MKKHVKMISVICLMAVACMVFGIGAAPVSATDFKLGATLVNLSNADVSCLSSSASYQIGDINNDGKCKTSDCLTLRKYIAGTDSPDDAASARSDINGDGKISVSDVLTIRKILSGSLSAADVTVCADSASVRWSSAKKSAMISSNSTSFSVKVDLEKFGFKIKNHPYVVANTASGTEMSVTPLFNGCEYGSTGNRRGESADGVFELKGSSGAELTGLILSFETKSGASTVYIPEIYICENLDSAEWIYSNRICPPQNQTPKSVTASYKDDVAIRLANMTDDDRNNINGGMYHDFVNSKWPSVAVDENDRLYVVASGMRMAHVDPFGATIMATSDDGGNSFSKPKLINNTIMDDRDAGIAYLGGGKILVSYFTNSAEAYLPGGENYNALRPYAAGGSAPEWAGTWDSSYNPTGGIIGTHVKILNYITSTDKGYDSSVGSFILKSGDFGETWNVRPYSFVGSSYSRAMGKMLTDYKMNYPTQRVPVTSCHGPIVLSDGTILYAGKVMETYDQPMDSMAVYTSRDEGETWDYLSEIPTVAGYMYNNFHELSVTETADGALLCAIRTQTCDYVVTNPEFTIYTCMSYDRGLTWTTPEETGINGSPPHVVTMENGDIVMTYGYRTNPRCIYAIISTDGGRTWSDRVQVSNTLLNNDDMGYPCSAVLSDGTICTVYYATKRTASGGSEGYSSVFCSKWTYSFE